MASVQRLRRGDTGVLLQVSLVDRGVPVDLTGATTTQIILRGPSGQRLVRSATVLAPATGGVLQYAIIAEDTDEVGLWQVQAHVILPAGAFSSAAGTYLVDPAL